MRRNGFEVDICDGMKNGMSRGKLYERLRLGDYDVVERCYNDCLETMIKFFKIV